LFHSLGQLLPFVRQRIKVVHFLRKNPLFNKPLDNVKHCGARVGIIASSFKELVQIQNIFAPDTKTSQNLFGEFVHFSESRQASFDSACANFETMAFTSGGIARPFASSIGGAGAAMWPAVETVEPPTLFIPGMGNLPSDLRYSNGLAANITAITRHTVMMKSVSVVR